MSIALYYTTGPTSESNKKKFEFTEQIITGSGDKFYQQLELRKQQLAENSEEKYQLIGLYRLSKKDLILTDYYRLDESLCQNRFLKGSWTKKYDITSKSDLISMPLIQTNIVLELSNIYYQDIYFYGLNKFINNRDVTVASLVAVLHLYSSVDVLSFFYKNSTNEEIKGDLVRFAQYDLGDFSVIGFGIIDAIWQLDLALRNCAAH